MFSLNEMRTWEREYHHYVNKRNSTKSKFMHEIVYFKINFKNEWECQWQLTIIAILVGTFTILCSVIRSST